MFDALAANLSAENFYQGRMGQGTPAFSADTEAPEIAASEGLEFIRIWPENVYAVRSIGTCTDTDLLIPDTHDGIPVTIIETGAFWGCTALTRIICSDGEITIG